MDWTATLPTWARTGWTLFVGGMVGSLISGISQGDPLAFVADLFDPTKRNRVVGSALTAGILAVWYHYKPSLAEPTTPTFIQR